MSRCFYSRRRTDTAVLYYKATLRSTVTWVSVPEYYLPLVIKNILTEVFLIGLPLLDVHKMLLQSIWLYYRYSWSYMSPIKVKVSPVKLYFVVFTVENTWVFKKYTHQATINDYFNSQLVNIFLITIVDWSNHCVFNAILGFLSDLVQIYRYKTSWRKWS